MYLKPITINELEYSAILSNKLSVFHDIDFLNIYLPYIQIVGIYNESNEIIGVFYYFKKTKYFLKYIIPPPFHPYNGLIFYNSAQKEESRNSFIKEIQYLIHQYFTEKEHAHYIRFVLSPEHIDTQVFRWNNWKVKVNYTYQLSLRNSVDELFDNLSSEKRKSIRRAEKDGIVSKENEDYDTVKKLILKTFGRQKKSVNDLYLHKILKEWANSSNSFAYTAYLGAQPIATTFCVYDHSTAYYLLGGYDEQKAHHGAGVLCMWNSILKSKELGLNTFDFEGSMLPNVERYFRDFGGKLIPYFVCEKWRLF
ncbi:MAG: GNAT family N-acetyltransferase [Bacteroidetes bacterium]|nr:MAG: GNAT family N-acetyltransferase [Bacteroidota bacterium]